MHRNVNGIGSMKCKQLNPIDSSNWYADNEVARLGKQNKKQQVAGSMKNFFSWFSLLSIGQLLQFHNVAHYIFFLLIFRRNLQLSAIRLTIILVRLLSCQICFGFFPIIFSLLSQWAFVTNIFFFWTNR